MHSSSNQSGDLHCMSKHTLCRTVLMMLCIFTFRELAAEDLQLTQITTALLKGIQQTGKKRIAVVDFVDLDGNPSRLGKYIAEELSVELTQSADGIEVVDRAHLQAILQEHKLKSEGLLDPETTKQLGLLAGVDILVTGSLTDIGDSIRIVAKALSTDSARIVAASSGSLLKTHEILSLLAPAPSMEAKSANVSSTGPSALPKQPAATSVTVGPVFIELTGCHASSSSVTCRFRVRDVGDDCYFNFFTVGSVAYDDQGNQAKAADGSLANQRSENDINGGRIIYSRMFSNVFTNAEFRFEGISAQASSLPLINLHMDVDHRQKYDVQFRNVPLVR